MNTFIDAMNDYKHGTLNKVRQKQDRINDAIKTLDLSDITPLLRQKTAKEAAIFLKEVIDRVIVIDYQKIPDQNDLHRWRLKDTDITIIQIQEGEHRGKYLFSKNTVQEAKRFYQTVQHLPYLENSGMGAGYKTPLGEQIVPQWSKNKFGPLFLWQLLGLILAVLLSFPIIYSTKLLLSTMLIVTKRTKTVLDDTIIKTLKDPFAKSIALLFILASFRILQIEGILLQILTVIVQIALSFYIIKLIYKVTQRLLDTYLDKISSSKFDSQFIGLFKQVVKISVVVLGSLVAIQNLGLNVMGVMAGLGLGGLAFALAAKDTCANLFGSITIFMDKPFAIGDWIITTNIEGTVENIGFRSTKIRTFYNSLVSIPNALLATSNIDNMGKRQFRRMKHFYSITYDTPADTIKEFVHGIKTIISDHPNTNKDFHVTLHSMKDSGPTIMLYCFLKSKDWAEELLDKQDIHLKISKLAQDKNIKFSFEYENKIQPDNQ